MVSTSEVFSYSMPLIHVGLYLCIKPLMSLTNVAIKNLLIT